MTAVHNSMREKWGPQRGLANRGPPLAPAPLERPSRCTLPAALKPASVSVCIPLTLTLKKSQPKSPSCQARPHPQVPGLGCGILGWPSALNLSVIGIQLLIGSACRTLSWCPQRVTSRSAGTLGQNQRTKPGPVCVGGSCPLPAYVDRHDQHGSGCGWCPWPQGPPCLCPPSPEPEPLTREIVIVGR